MKLITSLRPSFFFFSSSSSSSSSNASNKKDKRKKKSAGSRSRSRAELASFSTSSASTAGSVSTPKSVLRRAASEFSAERITCKELELVLRRLGPQTPTEEEVAAMLAEAADRLGRDNSFRMEEILVLCGGGSFGGAATGLEPPPPPDELKETFAVFDADGDGRISAEELHALLGHEGWCTLEDCRRMIGGVDTDGDGYVCFEEFVRMMT